MSIDHRFDLIRELLPSLQLDAIALIPGPNLDRILNCSFPLMERPLLVLISAQSDLALVPNLELSSFKATGFKGLIFDWRDEDGYQPAFNALLANTAIAKLGVEGLRMRAFEAMALQNAGTDLYLSNQSRAIDDLRLIKSSAEINDLRQAIKISEAALAEVLDTIRVGDSEKAIENRLIQALFAHGAESMAFAPIVAAGDNSANPHASARADYAIQAGDALLFDFGAAFGVMNADISRSFFVAEVSDHDREFYHTVLAANTLGRSLDPRRHSAHQLDAAVSAVLLESEFSPYKLHKTGHCLGREVHETPHIMQGEHAPLEEGMVFTIEPGLYIPGTIGVRIEDDIWVNNTALISLSKFPRELRILDS